jgi:hypothetical protein
MFNKYMQNAGDLLDSELDQVVGGCGFLCAVAAGLVAMGVWEGGKAAVEGLKNAGPAPEQVHGSPYGSHPSGFVG